MNLPKRSLAGGELAPPLHARVDTVKYQTGLRTMRNFQIMRHGGAETRPGTRFVAKTKYPDKKSRLIPFSFGVGDSAVVEFGDQYIQVRYPGFDILAPERVHEISGITPADGGSHEDNLVTSPGHGLRVGDIIDLQITTNLIPLPRLGLFQITSVPDEDRFSAKSTSGAPLQFGTEETLTEGRFCKNHGIFNLAYGVDDGYLLVGAAATLYSVGQHVSVDLHGPSGDISGNFAVSEINGGAMKLNYLDAPNEGDPLDLSGISVTGVVWHIPYLTSPYRESDLPTLQYVQSGDKITITHRDFEPHVLARLGPLRWSIAPYTLAPSIPAPVDLRANPASGTAGQEGYFVVTAVADGEESLPSNEYFNPPDITIKKQLTWNYFGPGLQPEYFNIYKKDNGVYGLVDIVTGFEWTINKDLKPNRAETPPVSRAIFAVNPYILNSPRHYPSSVSYVQQRLAFGGTKIKPETVWLSRTGRFSNFTTSTPLRDDDSIQFTIAGRQLNDIRHLLDLGGLIILTGSGEYVGKGAPVTPFSINLEQQSYHGADWVRPVVIGKEAIFVQARRSAIRSIGYNFDVAGYSGNDLTVFSGHLFDNFNMIEMAYQQTPHSILWVVRDDGTLLGMTYIKEHEIFGWHRHDTDGEFESVCTTPHDDRDAVYFIVKRKINGKTERYIEVMADRNETDVRNFVGMDSAVSAPIVGGNEAGVPFGPVVLSSSGGWTHEDRISITADGDAFAPFLEDHEENQIHVVSPDGTIIRLGEIEYVGPYEMSGKPHKEVPESMRGAGLQWYLARKKVEGLEHLEGKAVSVLADGFVVASPNNPAYPKIVVENGEIELDRHYVRIQVGLPFISDLETLDIDQEGQSLASKKKIIQSATMLVQSSRGIWVGPEFPTPYIWKAQEDGFWVGAEFPSGYDATAGMRELKIRDQEGYEDPVRLATENVEVFFEGHWNSHGRVAIRQVDPLPLSVLSIIPEGAVSTGR